MSGDHGRQTAASKRVLSEWLLSPATQRQGVVVRDKEGRTDYAPSTVSANRASASARVDLAPRRDSRFRRPGFEPTKFGHPLFLVGDFVGFVRKTNNPAMISMLLAGHSLRHELSASFKSPALRPGLIEAQRRDGLRGPQSGNCGQQFSVPSRRFLAQCVYRRVYRRLQPIYPGVCRRLQPIYPGAYRLLAAA
jgi:hypothetical protein